ncbi:MAG: endonuclease/exonuclease/phosphatase family protein [Treponema sp.]|nr:endonuclease/exonuclease/phosphatase family protein [Treponema sp.]
MKKILLKKTLCLFLILLSFLGGSCGNGSLSESEDSDEEEKTVGITFASWNVQTFFDAQTEGTEYDDFKKSGNWSRDKYLVRLARLCEVMTSLQADVFVLEEIENEDVVLDIANQIAGKSWNHNKKWDYACFAREEGSAIGCAVFSRFNISNLTTHSMDIRSQKESQPQCRPIIQFALEAENKNLWVLVNHWKSKLGTDESRIWRQWEESLVSSRLSHLKVTEGFGQKLPSLVICGDFNQDAKEFCCNFGNSENTVFRGISASEGSVTQKVKSPWFNQNGSFSTEIGSYYYQSEWERIDHIFTGGKAKAVAFSPRAEEPWANSDKQPVAYRIYNGEGYSDHLPVMCTITF